MGTIYLLHFDKPFGHAKHYIGWTDRNVEDRIAEHDRGHGARLLRLARAAGVNFKVARLWHDVTRTDERKIKKQGGASRRCPMCKGQEVSVL